MTTTIQYQCPSCGEQLTIPVQYAGQKGRCRQCGAVFLVPAGTAVAPSTIPPPLYSAPTQSEDSVRIRCKKCSAEFAPDLASKKAWTCPHCSTKHLNLRRQYRSIADYFILNLLVGALLFAIIIVNRPINTDAFVTLAFTLAVLAITIAVIYSNTAPWNSAFVNTLIAVICINATLQVLWLCSRGVPAGYLYLVIWAVVGGFILYVYLQARKCRIA